MSDVSCPKPPKLEESLTPEQLKQFEALSPAQRKQIKACISKELKEDMDSGICGNFPEWYQNDFKWQLDSGRCLDTDSGQEGHRPKSQDREGERGGR